MPRIALIDGDIVNYHIAFAAKDDPVEEALFSADGMINNICDAVEADEYLVFLTGKGNFREEVASVREYKGNRKTEKPDHFVPVRTHLVKEHEAIVIDGAEADDGMGIAQSKDPDNTIICTIDKDLDMIPGWHYNWRKDIVYKVSEFDAMVNFYTQLLMGDSTDNIPGIPGCGIKTAQSIVNYSLMESDYALEEKVGYTGEYSGDYEEDLYWTCLEKYSLHYEKPFHAMYEMGQLLWIMREPNQPWEPKW